MKVDAPTNALLREMNFARLVAMAVALPPGNPLLRLQPSSRAAVDAYAGALLQGAAVCGGSATGMGSNWVDGPVAFERQILAACTPLIAMLQELLAAVYKVIRCSSIACLLMELTGR